MHNPNLPPPSGRYEARYLAFLETMTQLRPSLHRYCARMTGSVTEGEDVVQEVLFEAYRKLDQFDVSRPLKPWLFRIAHNRCIDFLRRRGVQLEIETAAASPEFVEADALSGVGLDGALEHLVSVLPPMERACVLLKDVFDHSLEETAELVDSTVGGVKAALHRGRAKIKAAPAPAKITPPRDPDRERLLQLYVERFNRRDWAGVRELISADARLTVVGRYAGRVLDSPYFDRYEQQPFPCAFVVGDLEGTTVVIVFELEAGGWKPRAPVRFEITNDRITAIVDYLPCRWMLAAAASPVHVAGSERADWAPPGWKN